MSNNQLSLQGLTVFLSMAKSGSIQKVASDLGLSMSTVSHHLRSVENCVGVTLLDHARRPMSLTPAGAVFARHVDEGLRSIRQGINELSSGDLQEIRQFRLANVDDFDAEVAPELAQILSRAMPKCAFEHYTRPSHEIIRLLKDRKLDAGITTSSGSDIGNLVEYPLLRDPFVIAVPASVHVTPRELLKGNGDLPFLRYSRNLLIGNLIETHLRRVKASLRSRIEIESNQSMMGMIADGSGWTITTPTSFCRAKRFNEQVVLLPFPGKGFSRMLSLLIAEDYPEATARMIADNLRALIAEYFVNPVVDLVPWLADDFRVQGES